MLKLVHLTLFSALAVVACGKTPTRQDPGQAQVVAGDVAGQAGFPGPDDNLNAVVWTQTAIEHDLIYLQTYRAAGLLLDRALADPDWDALAGKLNRNPGHAALKPAVILDVDETVLDNSPYQARLVVNGTHYDEFSWSQWCREEKAEALPGALEFTRLAASKGITVFYLTNRAQDLGDATMANLRKLGFPIAEGSNVFLGLGTHVPGCEQNGSDKSCRRELVSRDYRVLMQFGDQIGDFVDVTTHSREQRAGVLAPYLDWIGERWFVLPNPSYGHWESALFNDRWELSAGERRQAKQQALSTN